MAWFPKAEAYLAHINTYLENVLPAEDVPPAILHQAMRYSVFPGGKRIRPLLTLATADALGAHPEDALPAAAGLELTHTYTLIHDDLPCMDNDDTRRGRATCHIRFGEANALLAGDALLALGLATATRSKQAAADVVAVLAEAAGSTGVVGGQVADLLAATATNITPEEAMFIHTRKTASLFQAAVVTGALAAGYARTSHHVRELDQFARALGLAFQYTDDLLDTADVTPGAKPDFSSIAVLGAEAVRTEANHQTDLALAALERSGARTDQLIPLTMYLLRRTT